LDLLVYLIMALGGVGLGAVRNGPSWWYVVPIVVVAATSFVVAANERRIGEALSRWTSQQPDA